MCRCGHAVDWHSHDGHGDCEHDADCACPEFRERVAERCPTVSYIGLRPEARGADGLYPLPEG